MFAEEAIKRGAVAVVFEQSSPRLRGELEGGGPTVTLPHEWGKEVPVIEVANARLALAQIAAVFYPEQPKHIVGITGTNGKTSTAEFYRQLWEADGKASASMGTLGLKYSDLDAAAPHPNPLPEGEGSARDAHANGAETMNTLSLGRGQGEGKGVDILKNFPQGLTSADAVLLHQTLHALAQQSIQHVAIECSSHGLHQHRLDGVQFEAAAFTNLTHDHLDYHHDMNEYFAAKARLFTELTLRSNLAVINADDPYGEQLIVRCRTDNMNVLDYGMQAQAIRLQQIHPHADGLRLQLMIQGKTYDVQLSIYGAFQAQNLAAAIGLAMASGMEAERAIELLPKLSGVRGRMERAGVHPNGVPIFVDYAHTPDALKNVLLSLREHTIGKLHMVFGCGGDRDAAKRPVMGAIAAQYADQVIVTDDNPRSEDPAAIRAAIMAAVPNAREIGDRGEAIVAAIQQVAPNDVLIIAGKGHETYQIIGDRRYDFDDARIIKEALKTL
jgi:UDP-N-acetylmuramoyl-L-alanyl-D-glutamate--2,6-diaminopimelate ligase